MSDLPLGWTWATLEELLAVEDRAITDGPFGSKLASRHYTTSGARVIRLQNIGDCIFNDEHAYISLDYFEELRAHEARAGDLVVASLGDELPRACLIPEFGEPAIVKADCIRVRIHPEVDAKWVLYVLAAPQTRQYAASRIRGIGRPRLGLGEMRRLPIPLPPLFEQHRIVTVIEDHLSHLDRALRIFSELKLKIQSLRDSLLDRYFCNDSIRGRWPPVAIGGLGKVITGSTPDPKNPDYWGGELPFVTPGDLSDGRRVLGASRGLSKSGADSARVLKPGAVLTVCIGATLGKVGWIDRNCAINQQINAIQPNLNIVDPEFVSYLLASPSLQRELWTESSSTTLPILNKGRFEKICIHLPLLEEQIEIVAIIREWELAITRLKSQLADGLRRAEQLRRSLLHQAFAGRLVPQEPTDTPASLLLERLRAERAAQPKTGRGRMRATKARQEETLL